MRFSSRLTFTAAVVVTVSLLISGSASARTVSPGQWAPKFCTALSTWEAAVKTDGASAQDALSGQATDLTSAKAELVNFLDKTVSDTDAAVSAIKQAGAPSSTNGKKIADTFVKGLQAAGKLFASSKTEVDNLSTTDLAGFKTTVSDVSSSLTKGGNGIGKSFSGVSKLDKGGKLSLALKKEPTCAFLSNASG
jgi:hypothetical protein